MVYDVIKNNGGGWGNLVIVSYEDDTRGWYAHLLNTGEYLLPVLKRQILKQGQLVGYCGGTGGFRVHEHFHVQDEKGNPIRINFIDVWQDNGIPKEGKLYTSANHYCSLSDYRVGKFSEGNDGWHLSYNCFTSSDFVARTKSFSLTYYHLKGVNTFGHPISWVKEYHTKDNPFGCPTMDPVWIQDFSATSFSNVNDALLTSIMVLNPYIWNPRVSYRGVAYPLHGEMLNYWREHFCELGPPASNEFYHDGTEIVVQWFEPYPNHYVAVGFWTQERVFRTSNDICHQAFDSRFRDEHLYQNIGCPDGKCTGTGGGEDVIIPPPSDDYTINRSTTSKDANMDNPWLPINETNSFTINNSSETSVHSWIQLDDISKKVRIDWYWYDADGRKVQNNYAFLGEDGSLYGWWRSWCNCPVYNTKSFGKWKVQIYIEEELAITDYFYVNVNLNLTIPQNLNLSYNKELKQVNSTWNRVDLAESYRIYRNGNTIQETNNLYYTDIGVISDNSYTYKIIAIRGNRTSSFSDGVTVDIPADEILPPVIKEISIQ